VNNVVQAVLDPHLHNIIVIQNNKWNTTLEGNYWSNSNSTDLNHDGIGDTPFTIDADNVDNHPLMGMFHSYNTSLGKHVDVISNSTIEGFTYFESNSTIRMYISNMTTAQIFGFCRICIPYGIMDVLHGNVQVVIDDGNAAVLYPNYNVFDNTTHRWIYFSCELSSRKVDIIPEFNSFALVPLLVSATLLAVIFSKKKRMK
jgi:hypothetical protein